MAEVVTLLSGYPLWAGEAVIDHVRKTSKFIPALSDIHPELEAAVKPFRYAKQWNEHSARQIEDRRGSDETLEHRATVIDRVRQEMAARGMPIMGDKKSDYDPQFTVAAVKEKLGVSDEQWDAIPNARPAGEWQTLVANHKEAAE